MPRHLAGSKRGAVCSDELGHCVNTSFVHITYDPKVVGRAATAPHTRVPPLRNNGGHVTKVIGATLRARALGGADALAEGDLYVLYDGMKHGNEQALVSTPFKQVDGDPIPKTIKTLKVLYNEESLRNRLSRNRSSHTISQMEYVHLLTGSAMRVAPKTRAIYEGTNQGELVGFVKAMAWDDDDSCMRASPSQIKDIFGKIGTMLVGGANPDGSHKPDFNDGREPVFFHSHPYELDAEMSHSYPACAHIDLTCGMGNRALYCIVKKVPYFGLCVTDNHREAVIKRLETKVFKMMQEEGNALYQPALLELVKPKDEEDEEGDDEDPEEEDGEEPEEEDGEPEDPETPAIDSEEDPTTGGRKSRRGRGRGGRGRGGKPKSKPKPKGKASNSSAALMAKLKKLAGKPPQPPKKNTPPTKRKLDHACSGDSHD